MGPDKSFRKVFERSFPNVAFPFPETRVGRDSLPARAGERGSTLAQLKIKNPELCALGKCFVS
jgi:hypothetical protein